MHVQDDIALRASMLSVLGARTTICPTAQTSKEQHHLEATTNKLGHSPPAPDQVGRPLDGRGDDGPAVVALDLNRVVAVVVVVGHKSLVTCMIEDVSLSCQMKWHIAILTLGLGVDGLRHDSHFLQFGR